MKQIKQVEEFHKAFGVPVGYYPEPLNVQRIKLRNKILLEEVDELNAEMAQGDIESIAKEIADVIYVTLGTAIELGLQHWIEEIFDEVHRSNMSKLGEDGKPIYREDGKVLKSSLYSLPKLRQILSKGELPVKGEL